MCIELNKSMSYKEQLIEYALSHSVRPGEFEDVIRDFADHASYMVNMGIKIIFEAMSNHPDRESLTEENFLVPKLKELNARWNEAVIVVKKWQDENIDKLAYYVPSKDEFVKTFLAYRAPHLKSHFPDLDFKDFFQEEAYDEKD